ncbi:MAG: hypothetical protein HY017_00915 [Betaproteobacteria bacterium]|nr:hypothetical protein [Betaproteobacteria bacterium]
MKKLLKVLLVLAILLLVPGVAAYFWAGQSIGRLEETWKAEAVAERAAAAKKRRPVLRGEARKGVNAVPEYEALLAKIEADKGAPGSLAQAANSPRAPLDPGVAAYLERHRAEVAAIREAVRADGCDWKIEWERGAEIRFPNLLVAGRLADLLIVEGHERAFAGDARGAAERYLDAARFAADIGEAAGVISVNLGGALSDRAYEAVGRLISAGTLGADAVAAIELEIGLLDSALASVAAKIGQERLGNNAQMLRDAGSGVFETLKLVTPVDQTAPIWPLLIPSRLYIAFTWPEYDRIMREFGTALALADRDARAGRLVALRRETEASRNPLIAMNAPSGDVKFGVNVDRARARRAVVLAAAAVARHRLGKGVFPTSLGEAMAAPPRDPFGPAAILYQRAADGASARVTSAGTTDKGEPIAVELGK